ncbi:MAG: gluconolaconase [Xanthomonadales bacterium]|nr:gluconolaconase [Xanthomonadales bacterium]
MSTPRITLAILAGLALPGAANAANADAPSHDLARAEPIGTVTADFLFHDQMPTGLTVTTDGRRFVSYPRWGDHPTYTVAELVGDEEHAYPTKQINTLDIAAPAQHLVSVQSVVAPGDGHLWLLDTGILPDSGYDKAGPLARGAKLVSVDLATNTIDRRIVLPDHAALTRTYLNDVRIDTSKGRAGIAYITDSSFTGPGAIIVVDLASGQAWRKLSGAASTSAENGFRPIVEGRYMMLDDGQGTPRVPSIPADGIALSPDGTTLYYSALSGRTLYSVPTAGLRDRDLPDEALEEQVEAIGEKGASDGLLMDAAGRLYATDYEHNAVHVLEPAERDSEWSTLAYDPRLLWPDTLSIGPNGDIYVTANQLHRQSQYRAGHDARNKPYVLYRIQADARPIPANHGQDSAPGRP